MKSFLNHFTLRHLLLCSAAMLLGGLNGEENGPFNCPEPMYMQDGLCKCNDGNNTSIVLGQNNNECLCKHIFDGANCIPENESDSQSCPQLLSENLKDGKGVCFQCPPPMKLKYFSSSGKYECQCPENNEGCACQFPNLYKYPRQCVLYDGYKKCSDGSFIPKFKEQSKNVITEFSDLACSCSIGSEGDPISNACVRKEELNLTKKISCPHPMTFNNTLGNCKCPGNESDCLCPYSYDGQNCINENDEKNCPEKLSSDLKDGTTCYGCPMGMILKMIGDSYHCVCDPDDRKECPCEKNSEYDAFTRKCHSIVNASFCSQHAHSNGDDCQCKKNYTSIPASGACSEYKEINKCGMGYYSETVDGEEPSCVMGVGLITTIVISSVVGAALLLLIAYFLCCRGGS